MERSAVEDEQALASSVKDTAVGDTYMGHLGRLPLEIRRAIYDCVRAFHPLRCTNYEFTDFFKGWETVQDSNATPPDIVSLAMTCRQAYYECPTTALPDPKFILSFPRPPTVSSSDYRFRFMANMHPTRWRPPPARHPYSELWEFDAEHPTSYIPQASAIKRVMIYIDVSWEFDPGEVLRHVMMRLQLGKSLSQCTVCFSQKYFSRDQTNGQTPAVVSQHPSEWWHDLLCPCKIDIKSTVPNDPRWPLVVELQELEEVRYRLMTQHSEDAEPRIVTTFNSNDLYTVAGLRRIILSQPDHGLGAPERGVGT